MPKSSSLLRRRRFPSLLAALAMVAVVSACDSSSGNDDDVAALSVNPPAPTLTVGSTVQLVATPTTSGGRIVDGLSTTWSSSSDAVATVSATGVVTAVAGGTATITATAGGQSDDAAITVLFPVQSVAIAPAAGQLATIRQEGATQLAATILNTQGQPSPTSQLLWTSSNQAVATVSTSGRVSALGVDGTSTITATSLTGQSGTFLVTVSGAPQVATVTVSPATTLVALGTPFQLSRTAAAASGTVIPGAPTVWTTSAAGVATVSATGLVTPVSLGTATITATSETRTGTSAITVLTALVEGANVVPTISDAGAAGGLFDYAVHLPIGSTGFTVTQASTGGDGDLYVFAPGATIGTFTTTGGYPGFTCRPFASGSAETCTITIPALTAAAVYRVRVNAYPGGGSFTGGTLNLDITP